jgi:aspartate ammonia-lyase
MHAEKDSLGREFLKDDVLYGISTLRSSNNFPSSGEHVNTVILENTAQVCELIKGNEVIKSNVISSENLKWNFLTVEEIYNSVLLQPGIGIKNGSRS